MLFVLQFTTLVLGARILQSDESEVTATDRIEDGMRNADCMQPWKLALA